MVAFIIFGSEVVHWLVNTRRQQLTKIHTKANADAERIMLQLRGLNGIREFK